MPKWRIAFISPACKILRYSSNQHSTSAETPKPCASCEALDLQLLLWSLDHHQLSLRPWLPLFYVQKHHLLPSDKTRKFPPKYRKHGSQTQIHQYILMFKFQDSPFTCLKKKKKQSEMPRRLPPSSKEARQVILGLLGGNNRTHRKRQGIFCWTLPPFPIFLAINTVSIGCLAAANSFTKFQGLTCPNCVLYLLNTSTFNIHGSIHPSVLLRSISSNMARMVFTGHLRWFNSSCKKSPKDFGRSTIFGAKKRPCDPNRLMTQKKNHMLRKCFRKNGFP